MPPRRTTRKASVAPSADSPELETTSGRSHRSTTTKRKRTDAGLDTVVEPAEELKESENEEILPKPISRTRRATSRQASTVRGRSKAMTPRKVSVQSIAEENESIPSPPKRTKRQSAMTAAEDDEDEDEIPQSKPTRKAGGSKLTSRPAARAKKAPLVLDSDEDEDEYDKNANELSSEDEQPKRRARGVKASTRGTTKKTASTQAVRAKVKQEVVEGDLDIDVASEPDAEANGQSTTHGSKEIPEILDPTSVPTTDVDEQEVEELATPRAMRTGPRTDPTKLAPKKIEESDEEPERSLLDDLPLSTAKARLSSIPQQPEPEEPQGPKSRLVIHKMVLVNFKSYAGRQVIGPFHKVCDLCLVIAS